MTPWFLLMRLTVWSDEKEKGSAPNPLGRISRVYTQHFRAEAKTANQTGVSMSCVTTEQLTLGEEISSHHGIQGWELLA